MLIAEQPKPDKTEIRSINYDAILNSSFPYLQLFNNFWNDLKGKPIKRMVLLN